MTTVDPITNKLIITRYKLETGIDGVQRHIFITEQYDLPDDYLGMPGFLQDHFRDTIIRTNRKPGQSLKSLIITLSKPEDLQNNIRETIQYLKLKYRLACTKEEQAEILKEIEDVLSISDMDASQKNDIINNTKKWLPMKDRRAISESVRKRVEELELGGARKLHPHDFQPYKNNTEPKLPEGGDYWEFYVTDESGDRRRIVIDIRTNTVYLTNEHYDEWHIIANPWIYGGGVYGLR